MLGGCAGRAARLGNVMLVAAFGPVPGQLRHIDAMAPNLQLCLYMTPDCPSTIVYEMKDDGPGQSGRVDGALALAARWDAESRGTPSGRTAAAFSSAASAATAAAAVLRECSSAPLAATWWTKYFAAALGPTLDDGLRRFGRLFQAVARPLALEVDAGTLLVAGGDQVHAGPPTSRPRMFAFAIGIPEGGVDGGDGGGGGGGDDGANDGEVQYNPVLLHLDLCCILFGHSDFAPREFDDADAADADAAAAKQSAKRFLLDRLVEAVRGAPDAEAYERQLGDDRADVRTWLSKLARSIDDAAAVEVLLADATASESLLFAPDVAKKRKKRKYRRRKGRG